ncbi:MAG TPA: hypothetical protein VIY73_12695 [Polyangiaceae bacterium]
MRSSLVLGALLALAAVVACSSSSGPAGGSGKGPDAGDGQDGSFAANDGGDTWDNWAQGFFTKYCVECHAAGNSAGLDFGEQSIVAQNAGTIRCGVSVTQDPSWSCPANLPAKQFPISDSAGSNPKPTDSERNRVVAWLAAGAP